MCRHIRLSSWQHWPPPTSAILKAKRSYSRNMESYRSRIGIRSIPVSTLPWHSRLFTSSSISRCASLPPREFIAPSHIYFGIHGSLEDYLWQHLLKQILVHSWPGHVHAPGDWSNGTWGMFFSRGVVAHHWPDYAAWLWVSHTPRCRRP